MKAFRKHCFHCCQVSQETEEELNGGGATIGDIHKQHRGSITKIQQTKIVIMKIQLSVYEGELKVILLLQVVVAFLHCKSIHNQSESDCLKTKVDIFKPKCEQKLNLVTP